jgi:hypothetical protein
MHGTGEIQRNHHGAAEKQRRTWSRKPYFDRLSRTIRHVRSYKGERKARARKGAKAQREQITTEPRRNRGEHGAKNI